jgi:hypothetical protein
LQIHTTILSVSANFTSATIRAPQAN